MIETRTDLQLLSGILQQFDSLTIRTAVEQVGIFQGPLRAVATLGSEKYPISLAKDCTWQRLGRGGSHYAVVNSGPGQLQIACHTSGTTAPENVNANNRIAPDLGPGQSTYVSPRDCGGTNIEWVWVHASGQGVTGYFTLPIGG